MKTSISKLVLILFISPFSLSAQIVVKGVVTEQNSGGKMLSGVQIKPLSGIPEVSDNAGLFQLTFADKKPGDRIYVEVNKKGYELVNRKAILDDWLIAKDPKERAKVVMCPEGMVAKNMAKYYQISEKALTKGYREKIDALMAERTQSVIDAKQYAEQAKLLEEQFNNQRKELEELAEKFARENFDDFTGVQKQAADAFMSGNIEEALRILGTVNSEEEIARAMHQKEKGEKLVAEGKQMQEEADSIIQQNIRKLMFQADLYKTTFRFDDAKKAYDIALRSDSSNYENILIGALFYKEKLWHQNAEFWFKKLLELSEKTEDKAYALTQLGCIFQTKFQSKKAESCFLKALSYYKQAQSYGGGNYDLQKTLIYNFLATSYYEMQKYQIAKRFNKKVIENIRKLKIENDKNVNDILPLILDYVSHCDNPKESIRIVKENSDIINNCKQNSQLAELYKCMGFKYRIAGDLKKGESFFYKSIDVYKNLFFKENYESSYADNMGSIYNYIIDNHKDNNKLKIGITWQYEGLIMDAYNNIDTILYNRDALLNSLAEFYEESNQYDKAIATYNRLYKQYRRKNQMDLCRLILQYGLLKIEKKTHNDESYELYIQEVGDYMVNHLKQLKDSCISDSLKFTQELASELIYASDFFQDIHSLYSLFDSISPIELCYEAVKLYEKMQTSDIEVKVDIAEAKYQLAELLRPNFKDRAIKYYLESLDLYKQIVDETNNWYYLDDLLFNYESLYDTYLEEEDFDHAGLIIHEQKKMCRKLKRQNIQLYDTAFEFSFWDDFGEDFRKIKRGKMQL